MYKHDEETGKLIINLDKEKEVKELTQDEGIKAEVKILLLIGFSVVIFINCFEKDTILSNILNMFGAFKVIIFIIPLFFAVITFKKTFIVEFTKENKTENKKDRKSRNLFNIPFGVDETGKTYYFDIRESPHLLIAGASGWGKSVLVHRIITELIKISPKMLRMVLIDRKNEFIFYEGVPHLLTDNIIFEIEDVENILETLIGEMNQRYEILKKHRIRDIKGYNKNFDKKLNYIFVVIDEFAELMLSSDKEQRKNIERYLSILGGKARACGIHLILATQRPDSNIVTGLIKANIPSSIAFRTATSKNSEIIIDSAGAEKLKRKGEFLFKTSTGMEHLQGFLITDEEIDKCVSLVCNKFNFYLPTIKISQEEQKEMTEEIIQETACKVIPMKKKKFVFKNELTEEVIKISILENDKNISNTWIRNIFKIGAERSKKIIEELEDLNFISEFESSNKSRKIIITLTDLENYKNDRVG